MCSGCKKPPSQTRGFHPQGSSSLALLLPLANQADGHLTPGTSTFVYLIRHPAPTASGESRGLETCQNVLKKLLKALVMEQDSEEGQSFI